MWVFSALPKLVNEGYGSSSLWSLAHVGDENNKKMLICNNQYLYSDYTKIKKCIWKYARTSWAHFSQPVQQLNTLPSTLYTLDYMYVLIQTVTLCCVYMYIV